MPSFTSSRMERVWRFAPWVIGGVALAYILTDHREHVLGWLPYAILLACPLMHLFMHHGHSKPKSSSDPKNNADSHEHGAR